MSDETFGIVFFSALCIALVWTNIYYYRTRAKMTPEQRAEFDEEIRQDLQVW
jgi:hypothetical protein